MSVENISEQAPRPTPNDRRISSCTKLGTIRNTHSNRLFVVMTAFTKPPLQPLSITIMSAEEARTRARVLLEMANEVDRLNAQEEMEGK